MAKQQINNKHDRHHETTKQATIHKERMNDRAHETNKQRQKQITNGITTCISHNEITHTHTQLKKYIPKETKTPK